MRKNNKEHKIKICTSVIGNTLEEFLKNLKKVQKISDFIELRVDYIKNLKLNDLNIIRKKTIKESIFTCRTAEEGGLFSGDKKELFEIIYYAINLGFEHVDVEISKLKFIDSSKCKKSVKVIGSYHNFKETPTLKSLNTIVKKIASYNFVDIVKIATFVNTTDDTIVLTKLLLNKPIKKKMIVVGMGERSKVVRTVSPLFGGYLTFAYVGKNKTANGQMELKKLQKIYEDLE